MRGGAMKETYHVPRPPEIALDGNLVESHNSVRHLSELGFCAPEESAAQDPRQGETRGLRAITTPCTNSEYNDHVCRTDNPFHTKGEAVRLEVGAN
jgi:hypothetical protein